MADFSKIIINPSYDLNGNTLVEASAGTGKTYNIQNIYLRLILEQNLRVENILVVTFTEAATHELRERMRKVLSQARDYLTGLMPADQDDLKRVQDIVGIAVTKTGDKHELLSRLRIALMNFDNAAIFTIHGFCKRVLDRYAFECGHDPEAELVENESRIIWNVCTDWWRGNTYMDAGFRGKVPFKDPDELQAYLREYLSRQEAELRPEKDLKAPSWKDISRKIAQAAKEIDARLNDPEPGYIIPADKRKNKALTGFRKGTEDLVKETAARVVNKYALRQKTDELIQGAGSAALQKMLKMPECLKEVSGSAKKICKQLGTGRSFTWTGKYQLQPKTGGVVDLSAFAGVLEKNREAVNQWLKERGDETRANAGTRDFKAALTAICSAGMKWTAGGDAGDFVKALKCLDKMDAESLFENQYECIDKVVPALGTQIREAGRMVLVEMAEIIGMLGGKVRGDLKARNVLTFSDMLRNVRDAIDDDKAGAKLKVVLREEFKAALIDEFQDTDPVQYGIFDRLFNDKSIPLFFVGDPKQAIYGFRGGDVHTYCSAKRNIKEQGNSDHSLGKNFRSESNLVAAVNELFRDGTEITTFINKSIEYDGMLSAKGVKDKHVLKVKGTPDPAPVKLTTYQLNQMPGKNNPDAIRIYSDTADEIVRLIKDNDSLIDDRHVKASDVAVLICDHDEARHIHNQLKERNVNSVLQSTGNVFDSEEAADLLRIMQALQDPSDANAVRAAISVPIMPCTEEDLLRFCSEEETPTEEETKEGNDAKKAEDGENLPESMDDWMEVFRTAGDRWRKKSFIEAFRYLVDNLDLKTHVVGLKDGERRLTNTLQLAELAHQAAGEFQQGPVGLVSWFSLQLSADTRDNKDEYEQRLASDEDAVKIMTVFKSKGLQFPVVFVPTLWRREAQARHQNNKMLTYHCKDNLVMNLDTKDAQGMEEAMKESLEENMRLVYVAVTRAINRVYLVNLSVGETDTYALQRLINDWRQRRDASQGETSAIMEIVPRGQDVQKQILKPDAIDPESLATYDVRSGKAPMVDKKHGHTSFSSLEPEAKSVDAVGRDADGGVKGAGDENLEKKVETDIFSIPGGAKTGDCWHDIFEQIDFKGAKADIALVINDELERCKICKGPTKEITAARNKAVHEMVRLVLDAELVDPGNRNRFKLGDIPFTARRSELPFNFALRQAGNEASRTRVILDVLKKHWGDRKSFIDILANWDKEIPMGFMTGFIDLLFCHKGRFYIVDWKSNRRLGKIEDFGPDGVMDEMARNSYFLQYLIYTVAVHGFLSRELKGYDYEKNFGGIFYFFLRGVTGKGMEGIFSDRPGIKLIEELSGVLAKGKDGAE